jgi:hypothetical protein
MCDLGRDHFTWRRATTVTRRDVHVDEETAIEGHDEPAAGVVHVVAADDTLRPPLEDPQNASLSPIRVTPVLDAHHHAIAVHRLIQVRAGHEDAGGTVADPFRFDEREPSRVGGDATDNQIHAVRETEAMTANLDERPSGHERAKATLERRTLFPRNTKRPQQLLGGGGMIHAVADQTKNFLFGKH